MSVAVPEQHTHPQGHMVQFYGDDDRSLAANVGRFIDEGLARGDGALVLAGPEHREAFAAQLDGRRKGALDAARAGQLVFLDAAETLQRTLVDGRPDRRRFAEVIGGVLRGIEARNGRRGIRAYGELVGILWADGRRDAAVRLEEYWNALLEAHAVELFCGYPIGIFGAEFEPGTLHPLICAHSRVVTTDAGLERALDQAMGEVLGADAEPVRVRIAADRRPEWGAVPRAEAIVLWLRGHLADHAERIVQRARFCRVSYLELA